VVAVPVWMLRAVVRLFGFMTLKYVRGIAGGVFALTAAAGIALSISDHSHRLISYVAWYGAAGVAFVVAAVTTVIIDRRETKSERKARRQRGRRRLWPWGHPEELYPDVVDDFESVGGVPSRLLKTDAGDGRQEGTPWEMFAGSMRAALLSRSRSRWMTLLVRARVA